MVKIFFKRNPKNDQTIAYLSLDFGFSQLLLFLLFLKNFVLLDFSVHFKNRMNASRE